MLGKMRHPLVLAKEANLRTRILHWREIGVQLIRLAHTNEESLCGRFPRRHRLQFRLLCLYWTTDNGQQTQEE